MHRIFLWLRAHGVEPWPRDELLILAALGLVLVCAVALIAVS